MSTPPPQIVSRSTYRLLGLVGLSGAVTIVYGIAMGDALRTWQIVLVNFLFFGGLAQAGVVLSAILHLTSAHWARPLKRASEATAAFFPISLVLLFVLFSGLTTWAPWTADPNPDRAAWLNIPAFIARQTIAFAILAGLSLAYVYHSLRPDVGKRQESGARMASGLTRQVIRGWRGTDEETESSRRHLNWLAPAVLIAYGLVYSLIAFDFVVALDRHWYSTLAGGYYFTGNLLIGVTFLTLVAVGGRDRLLLHDEIRAGQFHDLGKLLFGFSILWAYMLWSHYLVIWYGDLPEETGFVTDRMTGIWASPTWIAVALVFVVPFIVLLSRRIKTSALGLGVVALGVFIGMWIERFILVSPSLWPGNDIPFGLPEVLVTAGVLSLFTICYTTFLETFPTLAVSETRPQTHR